MTLGSLRIDLDLYNEKLREEAFKREEYERKSNALDDLYEKMKKKKEEMTNLKNLLKTFSNKPYDYWQGNVFNNIYEKTLKEGLIRNGYIKMLDIIDDNLDEINNKRTYYQNLIYESEGIIGQLHSYINSIATKIENCLN